MYSFSIFGYFEEAFILLTLAKKKVADLLVDTLAGARVERFTEFQATRSTESRTRFTDERNFRLTELGSPILPILENKKKQK